MGPSYPKRIKSLQKLMKGFDKILITDSKNVYYYTGHNPSDDEAFLIINSKSKPELFVSPLVNYARSKSSKISFLEKGIIEKRLKGNIGFENNLKTGIYLKLKKAGIKLKPTDITYKPREIKDSYEVEQMRKAINLVKSARKEIKFGLTEKEIASRIEFSFVKAGYKKSFDTIVASASNGQYIHYTPGKMKVKISELTIVDIGAVYNNYCSDITRTLHEKLNSEKKKIYENIHEIQGKLIDIIQPGMNMKELQSIYKSMMDERGYKIRHLIGHGIGLSVHERYEVIKKDMVMTVEPGVYTKKGGCRIEDMILIKKNRIEVLSKSIPQ